MKKKLIRCTIAALLGLGVSHALAESNNTPNGCTKAQLLYMFEQGYTAGLAHCDKSTHKPEAPKNTNKKSETCPSAILQAEYKAGYEEAIISCGG